MLIAKSKSIGDPNEAEELLHDTLLRCMELRKKFEEGPNPNLEAWCVSIMNNVKRERERKGRRYFFRLNKIEESQAVEKSHDEISSDAVKIGDVLDSSVFNAKESQSAAHLKETSSMSLNENILECLKNLSELAQTTFLLNTIWGYKARQVATSLEESVNAVEQRLAKSRKNMGTCLSQKIGDIR